MPGLKALVNLIAQGTDPDTTVTPTTPGTPGLVARLMAAGLQVPDQFTILFGDAHVGEQSSPPRVVFVPVGSEIAHRQPVGARTLSSYHSANDTLERLQRAIRTDKVIFEVHVWGQAEPPDPDGGDHDATQLLQHAILQTLQDLAPGCWRAGAGKWTRGTNVVRAGQELVFPLTIDTPVLGALLENAPPTTAPGAAGVYLQPSDPAKAPELAATV